MLEVGDVLVVGHGHLDDLGPESLELPERPVEQRLHLRDHGVVVVVARHPDPEPADVGGEGRRLVVRHRSQAARRVLRIVSRDDFEHAGRVAHGAGERARVVEREREAHHGVAADAGLGGLDADEAVGGGGQADRAAGIGPERPEHEAGRHRRPRPARRAPRDVRRVPGIAARTEVRVVAGRPVRELRGSESDRRLVRNLRVQPYSVAPHVHPGLC